MNTEDILKKLIGEKGVRTPDLSQCAHSGTSVVFEIDQSRFGILAHCVITDQSVFTGSPETLCIHGRRIMAQAITHIIARGGKPRFAFVSLAVPPAITEETIHHIYTGMFETAKHADTVVIGGELLEAEHTVASFALYGESQAAFTLSENTPHIGDYIYATGFWGNTAAGKEILGRRDDALQNTFSELVRTYSHPELRQNIAEGIIQVFSPSAMADGSKGIAAAARTLCRKTSSGFTLDAQKIPVSKNLIDYAQTAGKNTREYVLDTCGSYELVFTSPKDLTSTMTFYLEQIPVTMIGCITESGHIVL